MVDAVITRLATITTGGVMSSELLAQIEAAAVRGWPALTSEVIDGWVWRATSGGSVRANTVAALEFHGADVTAAIAACERLYFARNAPAVFTVSDVSLPHSLDATLAARGYVRGDDHVTMVKPVDADTTLPDRVAVGAQPTRGWLAAYLSGLSPDRRAIAPQLIAKLGTAAVFLADQTNGIATTSGLTVIDGPLASVQCMATLPMARRQGGGGRVLAGIEAIAAQNGCKHLYLQTSGDNAAAQALYRHHGFDVLGRYHTRTLTRPSATV
jgi:N-acetylglutamate synthase